MQKDAPAGIMPVYEDDKLAVSKEEKRNLLGAARAVATLVCVIVVVGLAGLFIYFVVPQVVASAFNLVNTMPIFSIKSCRRSYSLSVSIISRLRNAFIQCSC